MLALAVIVAVALCAIPLLARRSAALARGEVEPASRRERLLVAGVVAVNTVPFALGEGGDGFVQNWIMAFTVMSLPFWLLALAIWRARRGRSPLRRCVVAEFPALLLQAAAWSGGYIEAVAAFALIRGIDGLLLYNLTRSIPIEAPECEVATS